MNFKRVWKSALCLLVACFLVFNIVSIPARATGLGAIATIEAIGTALGPVGTVAAASVIALGLYAGANPDDFDAIVDGVSSAMTEIGTNMKDGFVQMLQVTDSQGYKQLYVAADWLENVRSYLFTESVVTSNPYYGTPPKFNFYSGTYSLPVGIDSFMTVSGNVNIIKWQAYGKVDSQNRYKFYAGYAFVSDSKISINGKSYGDYVSKYGCYFYLTTFLNNSYLVDSDEYFTAMNLLSDCHNVDHLASDGLTSVEIYEYLLGLPDYDSENEFVSDLDVSLGYLNDIVIVDDVSLYSSTWNDNQIRVATANPDGSDPEYKVYFPLSLPSIYEDLHTVTQSDILSGSVLGTPDLDDDEKFKIEELPLIDGYQGVLITPSDTESGSGTGTIPGTGTGTDSGTSSGVITLPGWVQDGFNNLKYGLTDILNSLKNLPSALWALIPAWIQEGLANMVVGLRDILNAIKALPALIVEAIAAIFVPSADYITAKVDALRGEFGFIDSVIATGEFIRDSVSGASGPPAIYVNLGNAPSGNYGSQRVLLTDFSWYAPYKSQVDTVLSAALWAFFGWKVFLNLPSIIGGESGYISDIAFYESGGYYGGRAREIRSGRGSRSKGKGGK